MTGPSFPVRTIANTRRDRRITARSLEEFERGLSEIAWFGHLGEPSRWDSGCVRIFAWDQWPGPENALGETFALAQQEVRDRIFAASPLAADDLRRLSDRGQSAVMNRAPFDPYEGDSWHAPSACVWYAAFTAGLIMCVLANGWPVPDDLAEQWNWYEAGHWPSGFAAELTDRQDDRSGKHLTFPRRLLVY